MERVKFGIIGCGRISANHLDAIKNAPSAELVAVCDIVEEKAKRAAEENGINHYYTDIDQMISEAKPDVCCVLTPSGMHSEHAVCVANHGVNVLCEKPLDITNEKMQAMINACRENGVLLGGIFQRRTFKAVIETKQAINSGVLGRVTLGSAYLKYYRNQEYYDSGDWRGTWELDGGGALMNQGVHGIDLLNYMMGGIKSVYAHCENLAWSIDTEDTAVVTLRFNNGALGVIECATSAYPGLDTIFSVHGSKGSISFGDDGFYMFETADNLPCPEISGNLGGKNCAYKYDNRGHILQIEDMSRAVIEGRPPMVTGEDAAASVRIVLAIYESARTGREVFLND